MTADGPSFWGRDGRRVTSLGTVEASKAPAPVASKRTSRGFFSLFSSSSKRQPQPPPPAQPPHLIGKPHLPRSSFPASQPMQALPQRFDGISLTSPLQRDDPAFSRDPNAHPFMVTPPRDAIRTSVPEPAPRLVGSAVNAILDPVESQRQRFAELQQKSRENSRENSPGPSRSRYEANYSSSSQASESSSTLPSNDSSPSVSGHSQKTSSSSFHSRDESRMPTPTGKALYTSQSEKREDPSATVASSTKKYDGTDSKDRPLSPPPEYELMASPTEMLPFELPVSPRPAPFRNESAPELRHLEAPALPHRSATAPILGAAPSAPASRRATNDRRPQAYDLDRIDELDESNPLGVNLHHEGPFQAIASVLKGNPSQSSPPQMRVPRVGTKTFQEWRSVRDLSWPGAPAQFLAHIPSVFGSTSASIEAGLQRSSTGIDIVYPTAVAVRAATGIAVRAACLRKCNSGIPRIERVICELHRLPSHPRPYNLHIHPRLRNLRRYNHLATRPRLTPNMIRLLLHRVLHILETLIIQNHISFHLGSGHHATVSSEDNSDAYGGIEVDLTPKRERFSAPPAPTASQMEQPYNGSPSNGFPPRRHTLQTGYAPSPPDPNAFHDPVAQLNAGQSLSNVRYSPNPHGQPVAGVLDPRIFQNNTGQNLAGMHHSPNLNGQPTVTPQQGFPPAQGPGYNPPSPRVSHVRNEEDRRRPASYQPQPTAYANRGPMLQHPPMAEHDPRRSVAYQTVQPPPPGAGPSPADLERRQYQQQQLAALAQDRPQSVIVPSIASTTNPLRRLPQHTPKHLVMPTPLQQTSPLPNNNNSGPHTYPNGHYESPNSSQTRLPLQQAQPTRAQTIQMDGNRHYLKKRSSAQVQSSAPAPVMPPKAPPVTKQRSYMEPPPTVPEPPILRPPVQQKEKRPKRLLSKRRSDL
ncbi:hypothetical protein MVEN_01897400 [Mycena venus]|uniref:Uncharacterized protein n=1 Tax=Mycena venus TaxID=2733690 RepID=A0A8H6XFK5_9AGAR|nr:hypothetical protein MVEN_01897400 [Mycena venus]